MNPYLDEDLRTLADHARRFATDRITPGFLWWAPKLAYDTIHQCLLMHGHGGYDRGPMELRLRAVLAFQIGDDTAQIMKTIIARTRAGRSAVPA